MAATCFFGACFSKRTKKFRCNRAKNLRRIETGKILRSLRSLRMTKENTSITVQCDCLRCHSEHSEESLRQRKARQKMIGKRFFVALHAPQNDTGGGKDIGKILRSLRSLRMTRKRENAECNGRILRRALRSLRMTYLIPISFCHCETSPQTGCGNLSLPIHVLPNQYEKIVPAGRMLCPYRISNAKTAVRKNPNGCS